MNNQVIVVSLFVTSCLSLTFALTTDIIDKSSCGSNKTCYALPVTCLSSSREECDIIFTAKPDTKGRYVRFELAAIVDDTNKWFAVGFSDDTSMGDDAVFECFLHDTSSVDLRQSYNRGRSNRVMFDSSGTSEVQTSLRDGVIHCAWKQASILKVSGNTLDLLNKEYHLMLAKGPFRSSTVKSYHNEKGVSSEKISLQAASLVSSDPSLTSSQSSVSLIRAHGCLMIVAWMLCASTGIMIARYFKEILGDDDCYGTKTWFCLHRTLMTLVLLLVMSGLYCSYTFVGGWSGPHLHPLLGISCVSVMIAQIIGAQFRCHPHHEKRKIFNWIHFLMGNGAYILSILAIMTAYEAMTLPRVFLYIIMGFIVFHVFVHSIMKCKRKASHDDSHDLPSNGSVHPFQEEIKRVKSTACQKTFLVIYFLGTSAFTIALILVVVGTIH